MIKTPSLIAAYNFNGNANDESGNGYNGIVSGCTLVDSKLGQGYLFNSTNKNYIDLASNFGQLVNFTICFWCNPSSSQLIYADIFGNHGGYRGIVFQQDGENLNNYYFVFGSGSTFKLTPTIFLQSGIWSHICIVKNNIGVYIYVNSILMTSLITSYIVTYSNRNIWLGQGYVDSNARYWSGYIDSFLIYNKALSETDIKRIYEGFSPLNG